jgi:hypothetical protein
MKLKKDFFPSLCGLLSKGIGVSGWLASLLPRERKLALFADRRREVEDIDANPNERFVCCGVGYKRTSHGSPKLLRRAYTLELDQVAKAQ